jgi:hypothetical protein
MSSAAQCALFGYRDLRSINLFTATFKELSYLRRWVLRRATTTKKNREEQLDA